MEMVQIESYLLMEIKIGKKRIKINYESKWKTIKKNDCEDWLIEIVRPNAEKETEKQFSGIDKPQLLRDINNVLPPQDDNIQLLIKKQKALFYQYSWTDV